MATSVRTALAGVTLFALMGCGPAMEKLNHLASLGGINQDAPVLSHVQIEIAAPPSKVRALLVNAPAWPQWDRDITKVSATQPLAMGTRFTWGGGGTIVHSQVQLFEPQRRLGWTGTAYTAKAVHQWELSHRPAGRTLVTIDESMDGLMMAKLFSSQQLAASGNAWLASLKKAAETP